MYKGMPRSAVENIEDIDYIVSLSEIPDVLAKLTNTPVEAKADNPVSNPIKRNEADLLDIDGETLNNNNRVFKPSTLACPDCGSTLWELEQGNLLRFRCNIGHAFSLESLRAKQSDVLENSLWCTLRALEDKASLSKRMAKKMRDRNQIITAERFEKQAQHTLAHANFIRETLIEINANTADKSFDDSE